MYHFLVCFMLLKGVSEQVVEKEKNLDVQRIRNRDREKKEVHK